LGTGEQLVRSVTETRIEAARHANPLTFLPGNIPISQHIERLIRKKVCFVACYADLNNFKPFNDYYGYWRGDEMIRLLARLAMEQCDSQRDFLGHVGGDDFILLFQSPDWRQRSERLVEAFNTQAQSLFDDAARNAGGIEAEDRQGVLRFFPCTTVSIGAIAIDGSQFSRAEDVANLAALAKHDAKRAGAGLLERGA
jgi:diguanylate cyclase (GGDEF)-like protein